MKKKLSIRQAVINVCNRLEEGEVLLGYQLYNRVLGELRASGSKKRPLSGTVLRQYRVVRELCGMESKIGVSEYKKKVKDEGSI